MNRIKPDMYKDWLGSPATQRLLSIEASWFKEHLRSYYGLHMAYLGIDDQPRFLNASRCPHKFRLGAQWQKPVIEADAWIMDEQWPLADESVDVVLLQHAIDFSPHPHALVREAGRVLVPNGYLLIMAFNPYSLWGLARWMNVFSAQLPWASHPVGHHRMGDWLKLLECRTDGVHNLGHIWPASLMSSRLSTRIDRLLAGQNALPGSLYFLSARKTIGGVTPIRERPPRHIRTGFAMPVATRSMNDIS